MMPRMSAIKGIPTGIRAPLCDRTRTRADQSLTRVHCVNILPEACTDTTVSNFILSMILTRVSL